MPIKEKVKKAKSLQDLAPRSMLLKIHTIGREDTVTESAVLEVFHDQERIFTDKGAIEPPYPFESLAFLYENSNSLRQNIDAYVTNIDSFGHRFEPVVNLEGKEADAIISEAIFIERLTKMEDEATRAGSSDPVDELKIAEATEQEIEERKKRLRAQARREKSRLIQFFDFINPEEDFTAIRRKTREHHELIGNAFWEPLRTVQGELAGVQYVPPMHMRLFPKDPKPIEVDFRTKLTPITWQVQKRFRTFRKFIQMIPGQNPVFFKEYGDPRIMSRATGKYYTDLDALEKLEKGVKPATEILHWKIESIRSPYGVPRWIGNLISVLGSRQAEEVNFLYFENKAVPPLAILVSGGRLSKDSVPRIQNYIENNLKGRRNFHKILILEAEPSRNRATLEHSGKVQIEIKELTNSQQKDELFQGYDENNRDKVAGSFRVPKIIRGETKDFNRATADAAKIFAEEQVFQPERDTFDNRINRQFLVDMGIRFWRFRTNAPITRDPQKMAEVIGKLVEAHVLVPEEGRMLAEDVFNVEFKKIKAAWVKQPLPLTLAGIQPEDVDRDTTEILADGPDDTLKAELSTGDLETAGGLKPAQGTRGPKSIQADLSALLAELKRLGIVAPNTKVSELRGSLLRLLQQKQDVAKLSNLPDEEIPDTIVITLSKKEMDELVVRDKEPAKA